MKRLFGGWLLVVGGLGIGLVLWLTPAVDASSRDPEKMARQDFDGLVQSVAERYQMHEKTVPMMWLASVCARSITHGGVHGLKVVQFEGAEKITGSPDAAGFSDLVRKSLDGRWSPMVRSHEASGEDSYIYSQIDEDGQHTRLILVNLDGGELNMVSVSLNPEQLAKWMKEQNGKGGKAVLTM